MPYSGVLLKSNEDNELYAEEDNDFESVNLSDASMKDKNIAKATKDLNLYDKKEATNDNEKWFIDPK